MRRTPAERAIIYAGTLGGLSLDDINAMLKKITPLPEMLNESSYSMLCSKAYQDGMKNRMGSPGTVGNQFGDLIFHPLPIGIV